MADGAFEPILSVTRFPSAFPVLGAGFGATSEVDAAARLTLAIRLEITDGLLRAQTCAPKLSPAEILAAFAPGGRCSLERGKWLVAKAAGRSALISSYGIRHVADALAMANAPLQASAVYDSAEYILAIWVATTDKTESKALASSSGLQVHGSEVRVFRAMGRESFGRKAKYLAFGTSRPQLSVDEQYRGGGGGADGASADGASGASVDSGRGDGNEAPAQSRSFHGVWKIYSDGRRVRCALIFLDPPACQGPVGATGAAASALKNSS